jgi:cytochrome c biogenesis protein
VFRRQLPLLVFHLSLVVVLLLVAAGRLTYLKGQAELSDGESFAGELAQVDAGPWHGGDLARLRFVNRGFEVAYSPGLQRDATRNRVAWPGADGRWHEAEIGDQEPLRLAGYRFYTSFNKGFAPAFRWQPDGGPALFGTVHLPAYPLHQYRQARTWTPPGATTPVWVMLQFDEVLIDPGKPSAFRLPDAYELVVRVGDERTTLRPGESIRLPGGVLSFVGLKTWMGYTVFYDWTLPWLFAACIVAVASLAAHFWRRCTASRWDS